MLDGSADQRPAPDHGFILAGQQQVDGHDLDATFALYRQEAHRPALRVAMGGEKHARDAGAGDVGIEKADLVPLTAQGHGQQPADQRLAYAALAAHHGDDFFDIVEALGHALFLLRLIGHDAGFFLGRQLAQLDLYFLDAIQRHERRPRFGAHSIAQGTGGGGEGQRKADLAILYR